MLNDCISEFRRSVLYKVLSWFTTNFLALLALSFTHKRSNFRELKGHDDDDDYNNDDDDAVLNNKSGD